MVFMFPGQGCQFYQMGRELYQNNPVFHRWMNELDTQIRAELGQSVINTLYHDNNARSKTFDDIRITHPAIFMIEYALGQTLIEQQITPDYLLGASLGELTAAALAEVLPLPEAIRLVTRQGLLFHQRRTADTEGAMLAVLAEASLHQQTPLLCEHCDIAAYNARSLFVIAGQSARIADAERHLASQDIVFQRLPVNLAFHSRHIDFLKPEVEALTGQLNPRQAQIPVISCHNGATLDQLDGEHFWHTIRQPIRFSQTLARIEREAAERGESLIYLDLGPSGTLANLVRQNSSERQLAPAFPVLSPFGRDLEKFEDVLALGRRLQSQPVPPSSARLSGPKRVYMFPGQGSQRIGMGAALFEQFPDHLAMADEILGYSLKTLCLEDPDQQLANTRYTQPALYTVSALAFLNKQQQERRKPDFLAGHSLGEYCALFAAGAFSFETGLKLVKKRGELMAQASGGGMAAIIGRTADEINAFLSRHHIDALDVANYNSPSQVVLAGPVAALSQARELCQNHEIIFIILPVSAAFHSRYMQDAMETFGQYLRQFSYAPLHTPVIANLHAAPYRDENLIDNLTRQICGSVRWLDSIQYLLGQGASEFEEIGPGNVLSKLVDSIRGA